MNTSAVDLPLRDIHLPEAISWWPLALGWWILIGIGLLLTILGFYLATRKKVPTLKMQALKELEKIHSYYLETDDPSRCIKELSALLRRISITKDSSYDTAGLTGKAWLQLLDKPLDEPEFSQGIGQVLLNGPYQSEVPNENMPQLIQLCRKWMDHL